MPLPAETLREIWARALRAEIGIAIPCAKTDLRRVGNELYESRTAIGDAALKSIRVCYPNGGKEIWLVKATIEVME